MRNFTTLFDSNYLIYGLNMYESLLRYYNEDFILYCLALDDITINKLKDLPNIKIYTINDLVYAPYFNDLIENNPSKPNDLSPYHWALASMFTNYIMNTQDVDDLLYVDADIMFFNEINYIFQSLDNKSIGLITHKHTEFGSYVGFFNVGIIYFRNDIIGKKALDWWTKTVATKDPTYKQYATCGDQKYLELFGTLFDYNAINVFDEDIGHASPLNITRGKLTFSNEKIHFYWDGEIVFQQKVTLEQLLIFFHFSHFTPDYKNNKYKVDRSGEWGNLLDHENTKYIYDLYFEECKRIKDKYNI